jgi:hypothetical protein
MPYTYPIPKREDWQKIRDGAKVPKGAAKVSIGDSLEKVSKSFTPDTIGANVKATEQLIKDLDSYTASIKAKYPAFETVVKDKVRKKAVSHLAFLKDIEKAKGEYYPRYSEALETYKELKGGTGKPKDLAAKLQRLKGCVDAFALIDPKWEAKRPKVQSMFQICDTVPALSDTHKTGLDTLFVEMKP